MAGKIAMGQKDLLRSKEMELVRQKKQTVKAAGVKLKVSYRQAKRMYAAYLSGGDAALAACGGAVVKQAAVKRISQEAGAAGKLRRTDTVRQESSSPV